MPRKPRFYIPKVPVHVVQRGNNRQAIFFSELDYKKYLFWLHEGAKKYNCRVHAYVLMTNHVHLLISSDESNSVSKMIQHVGRHYVPYINRTYERSGTLWEGRYKANLIDEKTYFLLCMRYIEMNPVRAAMTDHPKGYRWSSYHGNAEGVVNSLLSPHPQYLALGNSPDDQRACYQELFKSYISEDALTEIRDAWQTGTPLGSERFREEIEKVLKQKVGYAKRGRPKKDNG